MWVRNTIYWSVGMQAVQWCHVHSSTGDLSLNIKIKINGYRFNKTGYTYEQIGEVYRSLADDVGVYSGGLLTKWGGLYSSLF